MAGQLNENEEAYFRKMFTLYDTDKSGAIGLMELKNLSKHLGVEMSEDSLLETVQAIGASIVDGEVDLDFEQFVTWLNQAQSSGGDEFALLKAKITAAGSKALNNDQIARLKEVFDHFDADGSGSIDADELINVFTSMGQEVTRDEMVKMIEQVDDDGSGEIEFNEFMMLMCSNFGSRTFETDMQEAFEEIDKDRTGLISVEDLRKLIKITTDGLLSKQEIQDIISVVPVDDKGRVAYMKWDSLWEACQEEA